MAVRPARHVVLLTAAFWGFARTLLDPAAPRAAVFGGYAAMGAAVLAKGLPGVLFPTLTVGSFVVLTRDWQLLRRLELARGGALFLALTVPWHLLIANHYPGFLWFYVMNEHVGRFFGHRQLVNYATLPVPTYLVMTMVWFCPWSVFLPAALRRIWPRLRSEGRQERGALFILLWAGIVIGFFAVSASRLEYYALPALPALALCVGRLWGGEMGPAQDRTQPVGLRATWIGLIAFAVCLVPAAYLFPRLERTRFYNLFPNVALPAGSRSEWRSRHLQNLHGARVRSPGSAAQDESSPLIVIGTAGSRSSGLVPTPSQPRFRLPGRGDERRARCHRARVPPL